MNTFEMNVNKANEMVNGVWRGYVGENMHVNTLSAWANAKKEYLAGMFGEELILEKEVTVEQSYDAMYDDLSNFQWKVIRAVEKEAWYNKAYEEDRSVYYHLRHLLNKKSLYLNKCDDKYDFGEKRKFSAGEKLTRGFKKLISDPNVVNEMQIAYSQMMNTKKLTGKLCLSIHPMDFLTMSHTRTWGSCYDVFNEGEYRAGAFEFMCSNNTICAYLYTKEMRVEGYEWNDKKWRCIVSVNPNEYIMTGKNYPYQSDELTGLVYEWVREITKKAEEFPTFEDSRPLCDIDYGIDVEYGYNDADCGSSECFQVGLNANKDNQEYIYVGYGNVPCPKCGSGHHHMQGECIMCESCDDSFYCECCDDRCYGDAHEVTNRWGGLDWVCYSCLDYYYRYCDECGEYHYHDDVTYIDDKCYCEDCRDDKFSYCEKCDEYFENVKEHNGRLYCHDCYDEIIEEEKEDEEEEA